MNDLLADQSEIQEVLGRNYDVYGAVNEDDLEAGAAGSSEGAG